MGFFDSLFSSMGKSMENAVLSQYGINRPRDALRVLDNIINSSRDNEDKARYARPVLMWLNKLSLSNDSRASEANFVLDEIRTYHKKFLRDNDINV